VSESGTRRLHRVCCSANVVITSHRRALPPVIDAINVREIPNLTDARERTCFVVARELLANKGLDDKTYASAQDTMGLEGLVGLVASTGSFSMTCLTAKTFGIDPPPANPTPLAE
jgi:hypothetical protein